MRHRIEAGAAQSGGGLDVMAIIVAGQEGDGDIDARCEIIAQLGQLIPPRGDLDAGRSQARGQFA